MRLHRLKLENFRQHANTDVTFERGMTAIIGPNGSGKSTLVEAVTFALYGEQRDKKETVRFHWATGKRFSVALEFGFDGRRFLVERTHSDASLTQLGEPEMVRATGLSETTRACERLLGLTYEQFVNSFFAEQKQLQFLQFRTNAVRQEEVARMLGFDRLRQAEELAASRRRELAIQREALERTMPEPGSLERERDAAAERLREAKAALRTTSGRVTTLRKRLADSAEAAKQAERYLCLSAEISARAAEAQGLQLGVTLAQRAVETARSEAEELTRLQPAELAYQAAVAQAAALRPSRAAAERRGPIVTQIETLEAEVEGLRERLASAPAPDAVAAAESALKEQEAGLADRRSALHQVEAEWRERQAAARAELAGMVARRDASANALARAEASFARGECPECGQPLTEGHAHSLRQHRQETAALNSAVTEAEASVLGLQSAPAEIGKLQRDVECAQRDVEEARTALNDIRQAMAVATATRKDLSTREVRLRNLREELATLPGADVIQQSEAVDAERERLRPEHERYLAVADAAARLPLREREHAEALAKMMAVESHRATELTERAALPFPDDDAAHAALGEHRAVSEALARLEAEAESAERVREVAQREVAQAEARLAEFALRRQEIRDLRTSETLDDLCAKEMRALRLDLNASIGPDLAVRASENLALLTNGRYLALELDRNFTPSVVEDGILKPVLSGGEEDVVALALRLALSELIQERQGRPMSLLILDEVFSSLDAERRQAVLDRLAALKGRFEQILVVTHLEEVHQVADHCLHIRRDPISRAATVSDV